MNVVGMFTFLTRVCLQTRIIVRPRGQARVCLQTRIIARTGTHNAFDELPNLVLVVSVRQGHHGDDVVHRGECVRTIPPDDLGRTLRRHPFRMLCLHRFQLLVQLIILTVSDLRLSDRVILVMTDDLRAEITVLLMGGVHLIPRTR
ncbi:hypothetical protein BMS3Bbin04_00270 [bacterium BMS3Bbin04]|nr:hypothetical protein BMS3Bbin04_00270 [bacterium BMS3Bbin04]